MKAIVQDSFGGPEVLRLDEVAPPQVRPTDLLVKVAAAGLNRADTLQRRGHYGRANFGDSELMGLEIAGEVLELGSAVTDFQVGDRVMGIVGGGAYAEIARIDHRMALRIPAGIDDIRAAAIPEVFVTAHEALFHLGQLQAGDTVLIHAAAGGVGSAAVQLARSAGARVYATSSADKLARIQEFGAHCAIDYRAENFDEVIEAETGGVGVDVVVDFVGAPYLERNINSMAEGGRLIQVGLLGGGSGGLLPLERLLYRRLRVIGTVMKSRTPQDKQAMVRRFADRWLQPFADGSLLPIVDSVVPLAEAAAAHRRMESGDVVGKIILSTDASVTGAR